MTAAEIDRLIILGRAGKLTPVEQCQLADIADEYRNHSHRLEKWVHDSVKMLEEVEFD
jgi:hypothetical protein